MKTFVSFLFLLITVIFFTGCSSTATKGNVIERGNMSVIESSPGVKVMTFKPGPSSATLCAPRESDFAKTRDHATVLGIGSPLEASGEVGSENGQGALTLGGRDPAVLILREMTYRACELSQNTNASPKEMRKIYREFLKVAERMMKTQILKGTSSKGLAAENDALTLSTKSQEGRPKVKPDSNDSDDNSDDDNSDDDSDDNQDNDNTGRGDSNNSDNDNY